MTLWVRETWAEDHDDGLHPTGFYYRATHSEADTSLKWRPSIFMPRKASRITLAIEEVRVQRLQEITSGGRMFLSDVEKEGCPEEFASSYSGDPMGSDEAEWFRNLWDSLNAKRGFGWETDPWCWVISFRKL